ncbi:hypothetical protein OCF84_21410 (plasmid) [Shewanella xiamenensis]|uniref:Uncharacterized protein n=1 Tax=Shewanella xiamenensis TaxID=332186 RepID=A0ABT6UDL9_9GAMM|nr:hypothetical protein [Shewanella xiamenensis]MDI5832565.1 hypothetical protein [Shewanella xiamenensis]WHF57817.1 hypothetical protein OCF84_21410 [Shewanella xiamenensis]
MTEIDLRIKQETKNAITHSVACEKLIMSGDLKGAIDYCVKQGIEPPQCSLTAQSANADKMRAIAERMLCDTKWWSRRLKRKAMMQFEQEQRENGHVTNFISDESLKHYQANKRK